MKLYICTTNLTVLKLSYFGLPYLSLLRKSWWTNWTLNDNSSKHFKLFSTTCLFYFKSMKLLLVYNLINLTFISSSFEHIQEKKKKKKYLLKIFHLVYIKDFLFKCSQSFGSLSKQSCDQLLNLVISLESKQKASIFHQKHLYTLKTRYVY